jgi:hypothetical protein
MRSHVTAHLGAGKARLTEAVARSVIASAAVLALLVVLLLVRVAVSLIGLVT